MTIQEAAYQILKEKGYPLSSKEIAKIAFDRGMVPSTARDPIFSLDTTIQKNIRDGTYNHPALRFLMDKNGRRVVGLPEWKDKDEVVRRPPPPKTVEISAETNDMLELARLAGLGSNETETIDRLIREGFKVLKGEIETTLVNKVKRA